MIISIIQPCFLPWLGYFEQIALADVFVYMDDVDYTKKDWRNGNQLKSPFGIKNIGFPVKKCSRHTLLKEVEISYNSQWEDYLFNQIHNWYFKSPYYQEIIDIIKPVLYSKFLGLVELNFHLNNTILHYLNIKTPIFFSSVIKRNASGKVDRIIELCKYFNGVDVLFDGKKAQDFLDVDYLFQHNIKVVFQDYQHKPYQQLWGDFVPYMSILDLLMNHGKDSLKYIVTSSIERKPRNSY